MFHKEGYQIIGITVLGDVVIDVLNFLLIPIPWVNWLIFAATVILLILILQFFRNPKRNTQAHDRHILAPVDGKVVAIEEVYEKEYFKDRRIQISVFMSPLNVHVTRYPIGGEVVYSQYHPGKYLVAWHPKSSEKNERTTVVVKNDRSGFILFRQIAGAMARRIVNYAAVGNKVFQGKDSGFIKFGSRVDVLLPLEAEIMVQLDQKVRGGESLIAKMKEYDNNEN